MRNGILPDARQRKALLILLLLGFLLRLLLATTDGYTNDISTFEAWTLTLRDHGIGGFYRYAGFADYPPGYFYVLSLLAGIYQICGYLQTSLLTLFHSSPATPFDANYGILHFLVKLPGILADLVDTLLIYALAYRLVPRYAVGAAACMLFNPAIVAISAVWGQVDSVAAIGTLLAIWLLDGVQRHVVPARLATIGAWVAITASILIKPSPLVLIPLFLVIPLTKKTLSERKAASLDVLLGAAAALATSCLLSLPFAPVKDVVGCLQWLIQRYQFGANVYPYNSVNAFNVYTIFSPMWLSDSVHSLLTFGLPQSVWGAGLVVICVLGFTIRFAKLGTSQALIEAAMLCSLAFFAFATRMHERYVFNALVLALPLIVISRVYLFNALTLTVTLFLNLLYSLLYLAAVGHPQPGVDARNLMPLLSTSCGFLVVVVFLTQAFEYVGLSRLIPGFCLPTGPVTVSELPGQTATPCEGLAPFTALDWYRAVALSLASFLLCIYHYWLPAEKIFDEIYYARSGLEYLRHIEQYEWTHPPFTKLVITLSMVLFGGIGHGDTSAGWRFLNVVVGSIMVGLLYRLTHKISGSSLAATFAAVLMLLDGFHFAQSRIATPEITVACLALATLTAFYEYWIAAQVRRIPYPTQQEQKKIIPFYAKVLLLTFVLAFPIGYYRLIQARDSVVETNIIAIMLFVGYCELGAYLLARWYRIHFHSIRMAISYPDGSLVIDGNLQLASGEIPQGMQMVSAHSHLTIRAVESEDARGLICDADGTFTAVDFRDGWTTKITQQSAPRLLLILAICVGLLGASKWNGFFDLLLIFCIMIAVTIAPHVDVVFDRLGFHYKKTRASWGNPYGFPLDVTICGIIFMAMTIYLMSYIPYFIGFHHDFVDLVTLQHSMYAYHHDLRATHPYQSAWWQWPLLERPISYYYHDFRIGAAKNDGGACCVAEILALPNPLSWWAGLLTVPVLGWLAWKERRKGYALLVLAYFAQWLPWIASPRIAFEYHFFPNLALICASNGILLERLWRGRDREARYLRLGKRVGVVIFAVLVVAAFLFWYPIVSGLPVSYHQWHWEVLDWAAKYGIHWI